MVFLLLCAPWSISFLCSNISLIKIIQRRYKGKSGKCHYNIKYLIWKQYLKLVLSQHETFDILKSDYIYLSEKIRLHHHARRTIMKDVLTPLKLLVSEYQKLQFPAAAQLPFPYIPFRFAHVHSLYHQAPLRATAQLAEARSLSISDVLNLKPFVLVVPSLSIESPI